MEHNFPCPISCDKDLSIYENFLNRDMLEKVSESPCVNMRRMTTQPSKPKYETTVETPSACRLMPTSSEMPVCLTNSAYFPAYLKNHIGKLIRVESLIANCLESRIGTLVQVGVDFIVIKLYQSCSTMVCDAASIKYITIIHDNDMNKAGLY